MKNLGWIVAAALAVALVVVATAKQEKVYVNVLAPPEGSVTYKELPPGFVLEQPAPPRESLDEIYARTSAEKVELPTGFLSEQPDAAAALNAKLAAQRAERAASMDEFYQAQAGLQAREQTLQARRQADAAERQAQATEKLARQGGRGP